MDTTAQAISRLLLGALLSTLVTIPSVALTPWGRASGTGLTTGWPLSPVPTVVTGFSPPTERWGAGHRGVDLLGAAGQTVHAPREGTVAFVGTVAGVPVVSLDHPDGTRTTYQPVTTVLTPGTRLERGQPFGLLLPATSHCAPSLCLHWGLRRGDDYLDPLSLVETRRIRLLPLGPAAATTG